MLKNSIERFYLLSYNVVKEKDKKYGKYIT